MKNEKNKWREMNGNEREKRGKHAFISFTCAFLFFIVFCLFFFLIKITHSVPFICILIRKKTKKRHNQELQLGEDTDLIFGLFLQPFLLAKYVNYKICQFNLVLLVLWIHILFLLFHWNDASWKRCSEWWFVSYIRN